MKGQLVPVLTSLAFVCTLFFQVAALTAGNVSHVPLPRNGSELYKPLFVPPSNSTPRFLNETGKETNPRVEAAVALNGAVSENIRSLGRLRRQATGDQPEGTCGPGMPCKNGACCRSDGLCGYCDEFCAASVCLSNCDAQAECGRCAPTGKGDCPLKVCCSKFGFCGTTPDFCDAGCQTAFGGCGPAPKATCTMSTSKIRNIAYYESWAMTRACDKVSPEDLDLTGLTHVNFAFAFFHPETFEIAPMDANAGKLYSRFTDLKSKFTGLQTWIAVGGWSFNDDTNSPNTRTAFSDMASTPANRKKFINSLIKFMKTYGFDGADFDWEYPGADDRGGRPEDGDNFVELAKEMKEAFGSTYGISVTLPASYWYLRHFKVKEMEPFIDWYNVMSYDIHGVWDSSNPNVGPYARPHSNLTEIDLGLQLLWRAGVAPENVVLGLGFYGRSFTLSDSSCNKPGCPFSGGAKAGECSKTSGVLTNAEIKRIIDEKNVSPSYDKEAAVKWITWDSDQWVSYDDETTLQQKRQYADDNCLGGTMIWAIDQDTPEGDSMNDYLGVAKAGVYASDVTISPLKLKKQLADVQKSSACYTSFCNGGCAKGYEAVESTRGQVADFQFDTSCGGSSFRDGGQSICCPSSALDSANGGGSNQPGKCEWRGYKGEGMACRRGCNSDETEIAANSIIGTSARTPMGGLIMVEQACNGGSQSFCCSDYKLGIVAGSPASVLEPNRYEAVAASKLAKRELEARAAERGLWIRDGEVIDPYEYGGSSLASSGAMKISDIYSGASGLDYIVGYGFGKAPRKKFGPGGSNQLNGVGVWNPYPVPGKLKGSTVQNKFDSNGNKIYGKYTSKSYDKAKDLDCSVTYTCAYGEGFDEVCDNQRYGVTEVRAGRTSYNMRDSYVPGPRTQPNWGPQHHSNYRVWGRTIGRYGGGVKTRCHCEGDEFPQNALEEAYRGEAQAVRQVDGIQNGAQGQDFKQFKMAEWTPCSILRKALGKPKPPVTWEFNTDALPQYDMRLDDDAGFLQKYGFNSMVPGNRCFARYTAGGRGVTISDHGFRVDIVDTMFFSPLMYNDGETQNWRANPLTAAAGSIPTDVDSVEWLRKRTMLAEPLGQREPEAWELDPVPPPEPSHLLLSPPSRVKRGMLYQDRASPASRPASGAPMQTGGAVVALEPVQKEEAPVQEKEELEGGFTEWRNASMGVELFARDTKEYCDSAVALDILEDMDQLYGYCDCMGWSDD